MARSKSVHYGLASGSASLVLCFASGAAVVALPACSTDHPAFFQGGGASAGTGTGTGGQNQSATGSGGTTGGQSAASGSDGGTGATGGGTSGGEPTGGEGGGATTGSGMPSGAGAGGGGGTGGSTAGGSGGSAADAAGGTSGPGEGGSAGSDGGSAGSHGCSDEPLLRAFSAPEDQLGAIPDFDPPFGEPLCVEIEVPEHECSNRIADARIEIALDHPFASDVRISVESPEGTTLTLIANRGGDSRFSSEFPLTFAEDGRPLNQLSNTLEPGGASNLCEDGSDCTWRPQQGSFEALAEEEEDADGTWTVCFRDEATLDDGAVTAVELSVETVP